MTGETLIQLALAIPALGTVGIFAAGRIPNLREGVTLVTALALFWVVVLNLLPMVLAGERPEWRWLEVVPGIDIAFALEPLGMLFACVSSTLWIVNSIYSIGYMRGNNEPRQTPFYACFSIAIFSAMGVAMAGNLFTLFLFYEILTISTYPLVAHKGNDEARKSGRVYLMLLIGTSMMLLLPAIIITGVVGSGTFAPGGVLGDSGMSPVAATILFAMFLFGIGKAAIMPIHFWLPAAMVAPTPVSALLHAVAVVKAGVFTVTKVVVYVFGFEFLAETQASQWAVYLAGFTVIAASLIALVQNNLKKRLAFSTVSQLSYVIMAACVGTPAAAIGAILHISAHAVSKITLFFAAGSIYTAAHLTEINQLNGIGRRMPWTMAAFTIGALAMIGVPPTATFISKWFMVTADMGADNYFAACIVIISTALNAGYFLPIVVRAFLRPPPEPDAEHPAHGEAPAPIVIALSLTAMATIALFLFPTIPYTLAVMTVEVP